VSDGSHANAIVAAVVLFRTDFHILYNAKVKKDQTTDAGTTQGSGQDLPSLVMHKPLVAGATPAAAPRQPDRKPAMNDAEPLCDLRFVAAKYQIATSADRTSDSSFELSFRPLGATPSTFSIGGKDAAQFAAELDVLAALIRARVIRARVDGEEKS